MEASDVEAWNFYWQNATAYVREFGLMSERMRRLGLKGVARDIFEDKLSLIHMKEQEIRAREMKEEMEAGTRAKPGDIVMVGSEND